MRRQLLISGGEGDLAAACVTEFAHAGWKVCAPSRSQMDVSSSDSVDHYVATLGKLDLFIANAGLCADSLLGKMDIEDWQRVIEVNLTGAFRCVRAVSAGMIKERAGHIVLIASYSALNPPVGQSNYAAAKAGLIGMAKSLAAEFGKRNVRVNVVVPGFLQTKMTEDLADSVHQSARSKHVLGRFNEVQKVAAFIRFLDQEMIHTSGQVFNLDSRIL